MDRRKDAWIDGWMPKENPSSCPSMRKIIRVHADLMPIYLASGEPWCRGGDRRRVRLRVRARVGARVRARVGVRARARVGVRARARAKDRVGARVRRRTVVPRRIKRERANPSPNPNI